MDKVIINARERPYGPDINDLQSLIGRTFSNFMRYAHSTAVNGDSALASARACYGLAMTATPGSQTYVTVSPGALMHLSQTLAPAPGALDSPYRIGLLRNTLDVALPSPGSATWYLLEAQVSEATTSEQRDILNATTGVFESTLVTKRAEYSITTQWVAGTASQIPVPSFGDWVTIGAVLVQVGGTVLDDADAIDLRPLAILRAGNTRQGWSRTASVPVLRTDATPPSLATRQIRLAVDKATTNQDSSGYGGGLDLSVNDANSSLNPIDPSSASVLDPATTISASTWYYLYLCPWYDVAPLTSRQGASYARGVIVLSAVAPDAEGLFNGADITLPAPFGNYTVPEFQAPCIGALRSNAANNGWCPMSGGNGEFVMTRVTGGNAQVTGGGTSLTLPATLYPAHAKTVKWFVRVTITTPVAPVLIANEIGATGLTLGQGWSYFADRLNLDDDDITMIVEVPRIYSQESRMTALGSTTVLTHEATLVGYTT